MTSDWKAAAEEMDALKDSGREMEGLVRVNAKVSKHPRDVVSVRMAPEELSEISSAAGAIEQNVSEFIREAALKQARDVRAGADQARRALAEYLPTRYRPDMTDEEVHALIREVRSALLEAFSLLPAKSA
jgi:mobilization protein NikA